MIVKLAEKLKSIEADEFRVDERLQVMGRDGKSKRKAGALNNPSSSKTKGQRSAMGIGASHVPASRRSHPCGSKALLRLDRPI
jgi:hypothetical protein